MITCFMNSENSRREKAKTSWGLEMQFRGGGPWFDLQNHHKTETDGDRDSKRDRNGRG